jgi:hypothetical protein
VAILLLLPSATRGQSLQDALNELFVFGGGNNPLFLVGSGNIPLTQVHGAHFIPAEEESNASLLSFFNEAIASNIASFPLSSTVSSETFKFVNGVPQTTSNSFGPIFAERAQTIGKGRLNATFNYSRLRFSTMRGQDLDDIELTFVHENVDFPGCDAIFGGDCTTSGIPQFENDEINLVLDLNIDADVYAFATTFGVTDWLDVGVAVPVVNLELEGTSTATILPTTGSEVLHFFGGTPEAPILDAESNVDESATGIGDVAGRLKARVVDGDKWGFAVLGDVRVPTGREEDFLGRGEWSGGGLLIWSGVFSNFSPHANVGYRWRGGDTEQDAFVLATGFDHRLADWATLAVDLLGAFPVGEGELSFPAPVRIDAPFPREIRRTNIPDRRDDIVDGSLGFKFKTPAGVVLVTNVVVPLNGGGMRPSPIPTFGLEYSP